MPAVEALPSVADMDRLITCVLETERKIAGATQQRLETRIRAIAADLATAAAAGEEIESLYEQLGVALKERQSIASNARSQAFNEIERDDAFAERIHLRVLAQPS